MTRSKIQKLKFFIFLLIFLLAQTAVSDGIFREKKDAPSADGDGDGKRVVPVADESASSTNKKLGDKDGQKNAAGSPVDAKKPAPDGNRTQHDGLTSKSPYVVAANKTVHPVDTSSEVRIFVGSRPRSRKRRPRFYFLEQKVNKHTGVSWSVVRTSGKNNDPA